MKANPGGVIDPGNVYGRDQLIAQLWGRLEQQSVLMNAERRIGKTSVLRKMAHDGASGWFPTMIDVEKFHSAEEFARGVFDQVQTYLGKWKKAANLARDLYEQHDFGGIRRTGAPRPWKALLTAAIHDLATQMHEQRLVFLWDELPYMIDHIRQADGGRAALEVLDTLRSLRQEHPGIRMVFSGSIGLHHVLEGARDGKISSEPVNDMYAVEVPPLDIEDAIRLAGDLIQGEGLGVKDLRGSAEVVVKEADGFPFYIHHIVAGLKRKQRAAEPDQIRMVVQDHLVDANDPWDLGHYRSRIPIYYPKGNNAQIASLILDALATDQEPRSVADLQAAINASSAVLEDRSELVRILRLMERDHYLLRQTDGRIQFRFPLIRRWWALDRGL